MAYFEKPKTRIVQLTSTGDAKSPVDNKPYWIETVDKIRWGVTKQTAQIEGQEVNFVTSADEMLKHVIKDWNLDGEDGQKAPLDSEHFDLLDRDDVFLILDQLGADVESNAAAKKN